MMGNVVVIKETPMLGAQGLHFGAAESSIVREPIQMSGEKNLITTIARAPRLIGRALVKLYRFTLSPLIGFHCRYLPTCSDYADQALDKHGLWAGGWMTLARLLRCHPWGNSGLDFVPPVLPPDARWYLPWRYGRWRGTNPAP
jgi:putative membrane protein insertion efficiency factor